MAHIDASRTIAAHRVGHQLSLDVDGHRAPPSVNAPEHDAWSRASAHLARTRIWLAIHDNQPAIPITRTRSTTELHQRQAQLEAIFATAPPDHSRLIDTLTTG